MVLDIKDSQEYFNAIAGDQTVIVFFYASWAGPSRKIEPAFVSYASQFREIRFLSVDVDKFDEIVESNGVTTLPAFQVFKSGNKVDEIMGVSISEGKLGDLLKKVS